METTANERWVARQNLILRSLAIRPAVIQVVAAVVQSGQRYLLCQRPANKRHGGLWEFPGGKVLAGETLAMAAERELAEELGVRTVGFQGEIGRFQDEGSEFVIHFVGVEIQGEPFAHEHQRLGWFSAAQMRQMALAPADRDFISLIGCVGSD